MSSIQQYTYLEIRHDATGLLEIANQYTQAFDSTQFRKIVVLLKGEYSAKLAARIPADRIIFLQLSSLGGLNTRAVFKLLSICRRNRVTHILAHRYKPTLIAALVALFFRPSLIVGVMHGNHQFARLGRRLAARTVLHKPNIKIIGVSESTRRDILKSLPYYNSAAVVAVPNCIDIESTENQMLNRETAQAQLQLRPDQFVFGNVGRLSPTKDQLTLLRAFHSAQSRIKGSVLVIIGGGRLEPVLKHEAYKLGIQNNVIFTGAIEEAWRLMKAFDCFVSTSVTEGFGLVIVESMVARCTLIATDISSFAEILGDTVNLIECGNHKAIGHAMEEHYRMPQSDRAKLVEKLFLRVKSEFSTELFRKRVQAIYQS